MKTLKLIFTLLVLFVASVNAKNTRDIQDFNQNWKFTLADSALNASTIVFDDSKWRTLNLPFFQKLNKVILY